MKEEEMEEQAIELPELPPGEPVELPGISATIYDASHMREYARQAVLAERERAATVADQKAESIRRANTYRGNVNQIGEYAAEMVDAVAAAIRATAGKE
jgi:hypothetical protein